MTYRKSKRLAALAAVACAVLLAGCGAEPRQNQVGTINGSTSANPYGQAGCVPLVQSGGTYGYYSQVALGFTGQNISFTWANILGGRIPYSAQQVGQMLVTTGGTAGGQLGRTNYYGSTISMNVTTATQGQVPYQNYPQGSWPYQNPGMMPGTWPGYSAPYYPYGSYQGQTANITGSLMLSPTEVQIIMSRYGGYSYPTYPTYPTYPSTTPTTPTAPQVCVSGIALDLGHYNNIVYGGKVYLYINSTSSGYYVEF